MRQESGTKTLTPSAHRELPRTCHLSLPNHFLLRLYILNTHTHTHKHTLDATHVRVRTVNNGRSNGAALHPRESACTVECYVKGSHFRCACVSWQPWGKGGPFDPYQRFYHKEVSILVARVRARSLSLSVPSPPYTPPLHPSLFPVHISHYPVTCAVVLCLRAGVCGGHVWNGESRKVGTGTATNSRS
jgi:hypothetical protein